MTKAEIVSEIASKTGIDKREVLMVVESLMDTIKTTMTNGEEVFLRGFGSFIIKRRAEKDCKKYIKEYHNDCTCSQHSGIQTCKRISGESKIRII